MYLQGDQEKTDFEVIKELIDEPLEVGEERYLVGAKWWDKFVEGLDTWIYNHSKTEQYCPAPCANDELLDFYDCRTAACCKDSRPLKECLSLTDFIGVPPKAWKMILESCGLNKNSRVIKRRVIQISRHNLAIEVYPCFVEICLYEKTDITVGKLFSRITTFEQISEEIKRIFDIETNNETRIWIGSYSKCPKVFIAPYSNPELKRDISYSKARKLTYIHSIADVNLVSHSVLGLEIETDNRKWPSESPTTVNPFFEETSTIDKKESNSK